MELRRLVDADLAPALKAVSPLGLGLGLSLLALAAVTLVRLAVCAFTPLSADEAYYWVWSRALAPGYLDHPPMTALWIRAGTWLCGDGPLGVRLLAPLSAAAGTLLLGQAASDFWGGTPDLRRQRAVVTGLILNATLVVGIGAVTMTPDTPLLFFWTVALFALARATTTRRGVWWLLAGLAIGLALDSKYTAVLTGAGLALWLVATRAGRAWLRTPFPWAAGLLALLLFTPVLAWNAAHGWASLAKQGGRTGDWHPARALQFLSELLGGQIGLATPLLFVVLAAGLARAVRAARRGDEAAPAAALVAWLTLLPLAVFVQHAFGDRVQANWPGLLYPSACLAAGACAVRWWRAACAVGYLLVLPVYAQATFAPFPLPRAVDVTLQRLGGWPMLAAQVEQAGPGFVAADEYGLAAELARQLPDRVVLGVEPRWRFFALPHGSRAGEGLLIRSERRHDAPNPDFWSSVVPIGEIVRARDGNVAERYRVYRVAFRPDLPPALRADVATLPLRR